LDDLVQRAASAPLPSAADIERITRRARILRRRSLTRGVVGVVMAVALTVTIYLSVARTGDGASVRIDPAGSRLRAPLRGVASPQFLRDGTPVWVVRHDDGTVSVLSARSTHTPFGVSQLVGWCASSRSLEDGMYGSQWDERGHKRGGPAPSDLAYANTMVLTNGQIKAGPLIVTQVRTPPEPSVGEPCFGNRPRGYDPGTTTRFHFGDNEATSFPDLRQRTSDRPSGHVVFVNDAVVVVTQRGPARLCSAKRLQETATCRHGIPIADFDTELLRKNYPNPTTVIRGDLLLRPEHKAVRELTYIGGYKISE
jgi:hypothetical protein